MAYRTRIGRMAALLVASTVVAPVGAGDADRDPAFGAAGERLFARVGSTHTSNAPLGDVAVDDDGRIAWTVVSGSGGVLVGRLAVDGSHDASFGGQGFVHLVDCVPAPTRGTRLVVEPGGSIVVWTGACLRRFAADGTPDPTFADGAGMPAAPFEAFAFQRDSVGRWLLAGTKNGELEIWRYLGDGANDPDFGDAGVARPSLVAAPRVWMRALLPRPGGKVLIAGTGTIAFRGHAVLMQLRSDGQLDPDFGDGGAVVQEPPAGYFGLNVETLAVDGGGRLLVAGDANNGMEGCCVLVARYLPEGVPDPTFALHLLRPPGHSSLSDFGESTSTLAVLGDGRLLIARNTFPLPGTENTRTRFTLLRLGSDGTPDAAFGEAGWRDYVLRDPTSSGLGGAYSQFHGMALRGTSAVLFGRTFFEDGDSGGVDFVSFLRVLLEPRFVDGFEGATGSTGSTARD